MTPPDPPPEEFYDELAGDYHLIFADWDAAIAWEAGIIAGLLRELTGAAISEEAIMRPALGESGAPAAAAQ